jgi:hypothetical protein
MVQGRHQIANKFPCLPQAGMIEIQNFNKNSFGHLPAAAGREWVIGIYLRFVIWNLSYLS